MSAHDGSGFASKPRPEKLKRGAEEARTRSSGRGASGRAKPAARLSDAPGPHPLPEATVQRQAAFGTDSVSSRTAWDVTVDPWIDAAHRGTPVPPAIQANAEPAVQANAEPAVQASAEPAIQANAEPAVQSSAEPARGDVASAHRGATESSLDVAADAVASQSPPALANDQPPAPEPGSPAAVKAQLGAGQALDAGVSSRIGGLYGDSFSDVRVHTDRRAAQLAREHEALAFTVGSDIAFDAGKYRPNTLEGDALLAHELAHVVQQRGAGDAAAIQRKSSQGQSGALEADADSAAASVLARLYGGAKAAAKLVGDRIRPALTADIGLQRCSRPQIPQGKDVAEGSVAHTTGAQLDAYLGSSAALGDYVRDRIAAGNGAAGNVRFHDAAEFQEAWVIYAMQSINPDTGKTFTRDEALAWESTVNAFQSGSQIHVHEDRGEPGTVIHEGIHLFANDRYLDNVGFNANEGTTEYFTRIACAEQGIARGAFYTSQRRSVEKLVTATSQDVVADGYFNGNVSGLESALDSAKGAGTFAQWRTAMQSGDYAAADALL